MDFLGLVKARYSVREYQDKKVEEEKIAKILEAGRVAPTAANLQPQKVFVVTSAEGLQKVSKAANIYGAPLVLIVCADHNTAWKRPFDGKRTMDIDASIITDHMMLQAAELGLGTVWETYFKADMVSKEFNLPKNLEPINILVIGYSAENPQSPDRHNKTRKPLSEMIVRV